LPIYDGGDAGGVGGREKDEAGAFAFVQAKGVAAGEHPAAAVFGLGGEVEPDGAFGGDFAAGAEGELEEVSADPGLVVAAADVDDGDVSGGEGARIVVHDVDVQAGFAGHRVVRGGEEEQGAGEAGGDVGDGDGGGQGRWFVGGGGAGGVPGGE